MRRPETPQLTADIIIEMGAAPEPQIILIERKYPPYGWALPGGFVDVGETLEHAAIREAKEETSLDIRLKILLGVYSDPGRDSRGHTVSAVYIARADGIPAAQDDAKDIGVFELGRVPELAFDHELIIEDYRQYLKTGVVTPIRV